MKHSIKKIIMIFGVLALIPPYCARAQENPEALGSLIKSFRYSEAIRLAEQYLKTDSTNVEVLLVKGRALEAVFKLKEAISTLKKAEEADSNNVSVLNELITVYWQTGEYKRAIETCKKITLLDPSNRYFALQLANLYYSNKDYGHAINVLLPVFQSDTSDFYVVKQLANCYDDKDVADSAEFFYRLALRINPYDPGVTAKLANVLIRINEINTAFYFTVLYLKHDPDYVPILKQNAYCNYLIHDYQASAQQLKRCLSLGDSTKFSWRYLGMSYYKQEKYDSAAPFLRTAFLCDTTDREVCFYYGVSAARSNQPDTGLVYLSRTMRLLMPPGKFLSSLYVEIASAYTSLSRTDTALFLLKKALEADPGTNITRFKIAYQYDYYLHKPFDALPWYREFMKNEPPTIEPKLLYTDPYASIHTKTSKTEITESFFEYAKKRVNVLTKAVN
jgi:tetratricopeptide (TPR) repeat protein